MSRAYRIRVSESLSRVIRAHDRVSTRLEILEVLPSDEMAELLARELEAEGYERDGDTMTREEDGVRVEVDVRTGTVTVSAEQSEGVELKADREGRSYDDVGPSAKKVREDLKKKAQEDLAAQAEEKTEKLQSEVTDKLERHLGDIRKELDQAVNRTTAEALKRKAAQLGQIKEMSEDPESGSLTIVVEV